jgi:hypothetical protein
MHRPRLKPGNPATDAPPRLKPEAPARGGAGRDETSPRRVSGLYLALALLLTLPLPAYAQLLKGDWVNQTQQRIDQHRKVELRVIVLGDDGVQRPGAEVRIQQLAHDFTLGVAIDGEPWPDDAAERPVWRCFNAVSLDRLTDWPHLQPSPEPWPGDRIDAAIADAQRRGLRIRWGAVVSNDVGRVPPWVAELRGDALRDAVLGHAQRVGAEYGGRVSDFDACTDMLSHDFLQSRLGVPMLRRLFEHLEAAVPRATIRLRFEDALTPTRVQDTLRTVLRLREEFIPVSAVALEQRFGGILVQGPLGHAFDALGGLAVGVVIAPLEIGGSSPSAAAVNIETFFRTAFAEPSVSGVYFASLDRDGVADDTAALIDQYGDPTEAGQMLDSLFRKLWWTDLAAETDELGNVYARVFAGTHRVTATLPDGRTLTTTVHVARGEQQRVIVLEPMRPSP